MFPASSKYVSDINSQNDFFRNHSIINMIEFPSTKGSLHLKNMEYFINKIK